MLNSLSGCALPGFTSLTKQASDCRFASSKPKAVCRNSGLKDSAGNLMEGKDFSLTFLSGMWLFPSSYLQRQTHQYPSSLGRITCTDMEKKRCHLLHPHCICYVPLEGWQWTGVLLGLLIPFWSQQLLWQGEACSLHLPSITGISWLILGILQKPPVFLLEKRCDLYSSLCPSSWSTGLHLCCVLDAANTVLDVCQHNCTQL